jgi:hypothetical protein
VPVEVLARGFLGPAIGLARPAGDDPDQPGDDGQAAEDGKGGEDGGEHASRKA